MGDVWLVVPISCRTKAISAPSWGLADWLGLSLAISKIYYWKLSATLVLVCYCFILSSWWLLYFAESCWFISSTAELTETWWKSANLQSYPVSFKYNILLHLMQFSKWLTYLMLHCVRASTSLFRKEKKYHLRINSTEIVCYIFQYCNIRAGNKLSKERSFPSAYNHT